MLRGRTVVAIKGLGGYHLACDPFDARAVGTLRGRKVRQDKPFALMARDVEQARELCRVSPEEEELLASPARPIVLLERREDDGRGRRGGPAAEDARRDASLHAAAPPACCATPAYHSS